jgi:hypothetical protein
VHAIKAINQGIDTMKTRLILAGILLFTGGLSLVVTASDKPHKKMTLAEKGEQARQESIELEQTQLQKAREAAKATSEREQKALASQQPRNWETEQREKAQTQFDERATREQQYLQQAQDAASQIRKIATETTTTEAVVSQ